MPSTERHGEGSWGTPRSYGRTAREAHGAWLPLVHPKTRFPSPPLRSPAKGRSGRRTPGRRTASSACNSLPSHELSPARAQDTSCPATVCCSAQLPPRPCIGSHNRATGHVTEDPFKQNCSLSVSSGAPAPARGDQQDRVTAGRTRSEAARAPSVRRSPRCRSLRWLQAVRAENPNQQLTRSEVLSTTQLRSA